MGTYMPVCESNTIHVHSALRIYMATRSALGIFMGRLVPEYQVGFGQRLGWVVFPTKPTLAHSSSLSQPTLGAITEDRELQAAYPIQQRNPCVSYQLTRYISALPLQMLAGRWLSGMKAPKSGPTQYLRNGRIHQYVMFSRQYYYGASLKIEYHRVQGSPNEGA